MVWQPEIDEISKRIELAEKMGGWVFHRPVDFSAPTPHITISRNQPAIMLKTDSDE